MRLWVFWVGFRVGEKQEYSKDLGEEVLLLIDSIELKLIKRNQEAKNEKKCSTPLCN